MNEPSINRDQPLSNHCQTWLITSMNDYSTELAIRIIITKDHEPIVDQSLTNPAWQLINLQLLNH